MNKISDIFKLFLLAAISISNVYPQKTRLPETVNSYEKVFVPLITADGKFLYFDRKNFPGNTGSINDHDDIWRSRILSPEDFIISDSIHIPLQKFDLNLLLKDGSIDDIEKYYRSKIEQKTNENSFNLIDSLSYLEPENLGNPLNTNSSDVLFTITPDGTKALVYGIYEPISGLKKEGFSITKLKDGKWSYPAPLGISNYYNNPIQKNGYSTVFFYGSMSADCRTLILALNRDDALGGLDLYVSFLTEGNSWTVPRNLGNTINTKLTETSPFLALDGKTLYFASNGLKDTSNLDLFVARRLDDSWTNWSRPVNLGPGINGEFDEKGISLNASGNEAYIVSKDTNVKRYGIYKVKLADSIMPGPYILYKGSFFSVNNSYLKYHDKNVTMSLFRESDTVPYYETEIESRQYIVSLTNDTKTRIRFESDGYNPVELTNDKYNADKPVIEKKDILFVEKSPAITLKLSLLFDYNSDIVTDSAATVIADFIKANNTFAVFRIIGHADESGTSGYNMDLSMRRAKNIQNFLITYGVSSDIIKIEWKGSSQPVSNDLSKNRRVEVEVEIK